MEVAEFQEDIPPPTCRFSHHDTFETTMEHCRAHPNTIVTCGPFRHACRECEPFWFQTCGNCGSSRISCSC